MTQAPPEKGRVVQIHCFTVVAFIALAAGRLAYVATCPIPLRYHYDHLLWTMPALAIGAYYTFIRFHPTIAALFNPANPTNPAFLRNMAAVGGPLGIKVLPVALKSPDELDSVFATLVAQRPDTIQLVADSGNLDLSDRIAALALKHRLPSFSSVTSYAEFGGLMAYGISLRTLFIRATYYVKRILDGAKPGDLPVEQPTRIELVINLKTAKALGLSIPSTLLSRADQVIE